MTAIPSDTDPVILVWDLRNANAPEKVSISQTTEGDGLTIFRFSKDTMEVYFRSPGARKTAIYCFHAGKTIEISAGTHRLVNLTANTRLSRIGRSRPVGTLTTLVSWLRLLLTAKSLFNPFRIPSPRQMELLAVSHRPWMMTTSSAKPKRNHKVQPLR